MLNFVVRRSGACNDDGKWVDAVLILTHLNDEYTTYIRLIDEILEQLYNYVIQSRRTTIETFPYAIAKYPLLEIISLT